MRLGDRVHGTESVLADFRSVTPPESYSRIVRSRAARRWRSWLRGASAAPWRSRAGAGRRALRAARLLTALLPALPALAGAEDYGCLENAYVSCLQDGRIKVKATVSYTDSADGEYKTKQARIRQALVGDAASLFYFFTFDNPELMVKVLDGCAINDRYWVFGSAGTDLNYSVNVTDMATGRERVYRRNRSNPLIGDVVSFPCPVPAGATAGAFRAGESSTRAAKLLGEGRLSSAGAAPAHLDYSVLVTDNATGVRLPYHRNSTNPLINDVAAFPCHP